MSENAKEQIEIVLELLRKSLIDNGVSMGISEKKIMFFGNYSEPALLKDEIRVTCDRIFDCFVSIVSLFMCRAYVGHDF